jgi:hypothetical protein
MECIIIGAWLFCGILGGSVLSNRGGSGLGGFALGLLLGPIGIIIAAVWPVSQKTLEERALQVGEMMKCPHCAELVRPEANVCRYCGRDLTPADFVKQAAAAVSEGRKSEARQMLLCALDRDDRNEEAWLLVSEIAKDDQEYEKSLRSILVINPDNAQVREQLEALEQRRADRDRAAKRGAIIFVVAVVAIVAVLGSAWVILTLWTQLTG